jgi:hypothetical protein
MPVPILDPGADPQEQKRLEMLRGLASQTKAEQKKKRPPPPPRKKKKLILPGGGY